MTTNKPTKKPKQRKPRARKPKRQTDRRDDETVSEWLERMIDEGWIRAEDWD